MTAHRARTHARHYRPAPARAVPVHLAHLHPDWLPPGGYNGDGGYLDPTDNLDALTADAPPDCPAPAFGGVGASVVHPACPDPYAPAVPQTEPADENVIFHAAYLPGGRETQLVHTALPLRHRIYALHCQGRSISDIARRLRLDRGTVARHLHATEDLLLAEQTADLARLRLRAVEAQHAILAACWEALLCEELSESDASNDHPYPARRAQLLATAARAARTAAQLQGLFTPAALAAALQSTGVLAPAPAAPPDPAASCGMPAAASAAAAPLAEKTGLPVELNSTACPSTTSPAGPTPIDPAANCGMPASASPCPASHSAPSGSRSTAAGAVCLPLSRARGRGPGGGGQSTSVYRV